MDSAAPQSIIVMGVSGSGKTTVAQGVAKATGFRFAEGDDFHSQANRDKMASGHPLTDEDRWPWLRTIGEWISERTAAGESTVVTCSALKRTYRDLLREERPEVSFCHVDVDIEELQQRVANRKGHYMPASLLQSQLDTLEPLDDDEPGVTVLTSGDPDQVLQQVLTALDLPAEG